MHHILNLVPFSFLKSIVFDNYFIKLICNFSVKILNKNVNADKFNQTFYEVLRHKEMMKKLG